MTSGDNEVRDLLLYECDLVFECRTCRSMFRGLPNLLAHKRIYCTTSFQERNLKFVSERPDETVLVVYPEAPTDGMGM